MPEKASIIKAISLIAAAGLFAACLVMFYVKNEHESIEGEPAESVPAAITSFSNEHSSHEQDNSPIDINKATLSDLMNIDSIGDVTSQRILNYRTEHGIIHDIAELTEIDGIGEETVSLLMKYFYVDEKDYIEFTTTTFSTTHKRTTTHRTSTSRRETTSTTRKTTTAASTTKAAVFPIDINKITCDELMQIDGVGDVLADKIISFRTAKGKITDMEQLLEIYGIGEGTLDKLCAYLYVDTADYSKASTTTTTVTTSKATETTAKTTQTATISISTTAPEKQKRRVNINEADAAEIADALLIDNEAADMIVWLRVKIHGYSNILEVLYLEEFDGRYDVDFYNGIKDYIYV
ncbi:helix-hairpin-helix domain-containing protein [Ruminococcus sp. NK3A76]|uniref:ComEA family DNA-binding protein n=1 Tax=Ruminococcus sp. NK3A76 TaxID=877411 RepID=UPI0006916766|nr:helix-hairpin-helix domain-containing protein [Ruminococcus sp. NK3A76]